MKAEEFGYLKCVDGEKSPPESLTWILDENSLFHQLPSQAADPQQ
jgi:hypothetical protein